MISDLAAINVTMSFAANRREFVEWFLTGGATVETTPPFMFSLLLFFTLFTASAVYYFTHITYRISILTLIGLFPCAVFIKASKPVPAFYAFAIAASDMLIYLYNYRKKSEGGRKTSSKTAAAAGYFDFAVSALLIAFLLPKPQVTPFYEQFEQITSYFSFGGRYGQVDGNYTEHSGNADLYNQMESRIIYTVNGNRPEYYKIQVYDKYDSENGWWVSSRGDPRSDARFNWEESADNLNLSALAGAYSEYAEAGGELPEEFLTAALPENDIIYTSYVKSVDYPSIYIIAPLRTTGVSLYERDLEAYAATLRTDSGEIMTDTKLRYSNIAADEGYSISFFGKDFVREFTHSGYCDISMDDYSDLIVDIIWENNLSTESFDAVHGMFSEIGSELENYPDLYEGYGEYDVSDEIRRLSEEITAGLAYDYEKAEAIESYFYNNGFSYDLGYKAPEELDTPEYFLAESKRGTCSDFATAFCLLAKAAGLHVRYVEGFNSGELVSAGVYNILTENAHAYPEVLIPGAGWVIYEPTVGGTGLGGGTASGDTNTDGETDYKTILIVCITILAAAAVIFAAMLIMPIIQESIFKLRIKRSDGGAAVILIYNRLSGRIGKKYRTDTSVMTASDINSLIKEKTGISADNLVTDFERACYNNENISDEAVRSALDKYKNIISQKNNGRNT